MLFFVGVLLLPTLFVPTLGGPRGAVRTSGASMCGAGPGERLVRAVEQCGAVGKDNILRVTTPDVAAECGWSLPEARAALIQLVSDTPDAAMEVTGAGQIVYALRPAALTSGGGGATRKLSQAAPTSLSPVLARVRTLARAAVGFLLLLSVASVRPLISGRVSEHVTLRGELRALRGALAGDDGAGLYQAQQNGSLALACCSFLLGDGGQQERAAALQEASLQGIARAIRASKGAVCDAQVRVLCVIVYIVIGTWASPN